MRNVRVSFQRGSHSLQPEWKQAYLSQALPEEAEEEGKAVVSDKAFIVAWVLGSVVVMSWFLLTLDFKTTMCLMGVIGSFYYTYLHFENKI